MGKEGKRDKNGSSSSKMNQLKSKKRIIMKGKVMERNHILATENEHISSEDGYDFKYIKDLESQSTTTEEARSSLMLTKGKRKDKMPHGGDFHITKKKKKREKMSQDEPDKNHWTKKKNGNEKKGKLKKTVRREKINAREENSVENRSDADAETVDEISSVDEDCSRGMKKWVLDYRHRRVGLDVIQQRLDEFMVEYEAQLEQARKEQEARGAEEGWTVVVHHKGRKKTTDSESGIAVGSVAQAAVEDKMARKKQKEIALDFYRFQKREAQRNEVMLLQDKFEQDKKRLQQLRAARKFRPY